MIDREHFVERLRRGPLLLDGAMGTLLHARGVPIDKCFDELNLSSPALIFEIHRDYIAAGAQVIETNTFGANRFKLAAHGLEEQTAEINRAGVRLARQAAEASFKPELYVAGSVGPLGVRLAPFGRVTAEQAYAAFHEQIAALCDAGADLLILETFSDLHELRAAAQAARDVCPDMPVIAQATFTRDDRTVLGDTPAQVAVTLRDLGVDVIGVNCSNGPAQVMRIIRAMQAAAPGVFLSAVPNAGWPEYVGGRVLYAATPDYFGDFASTMRDLGVSLIGGCCGTTPTHIAAMRQALDDPSRAGLIVGISSPDEGTDEAGESAAPGELAQKLARGDFVIAVEVSPPRGIGAEKVLRAAHLMREAGADVIDVTDSPMARMRMSPWAVCHLIQKEAGIETVLHFPTRGRNLLRVQGDLLGAHALGIRNLFVVMGDPTRIGDYPEAADNYDVVPSGLVRLIKHNLNQGVDWGGNTISQPTNFLVSSALNVNAPDLDHEIGVLRKKIESGTDYLITQPVFDVAILRRFLGRYEELHGPLSTPLLVGIMPLYSARHASFLHNEVPGISIPEPIMARIAAAGDDAPQEGVRVALEIAAELRGLVQGLYLMPQFGRYDLVAEIIEAVRQMPPQ
ncbi:MAG: bifunctional homocysteine S-methyltransferase/methylenetetrahydrofolate reductase [Anaerolineae bacterium]